MRILEQRLPGVLLIEPDVHGDSRGFFLETWNESRYLEAGFPQVRFVQDNFSRSARGVLRGLHYQTVSPQGKLIQVSRGSVYDVAVDIRTGSPTFGQWIGVELSDSNQHQLWVPPGFAHGFCVMSDVADFHYKCTAHYRATCDRGIIWDDPEIAIDWPVASPTLSNKDRSLPSLDAALASGDLPGADACGSS